MTATIHCRTAASFVEAVTEMLGYCPSDSIVILPLEGNVGGAVMRLDLPAKHPRPTPAALDAFASTVLGLAMHLDDITSIGCVVFVDEDVTIAPCRDLAAAIERAADRDGLRVFTPAFRARNGWGLYDGTHARSLSELTRTGHLPLTAPRRAAAAAADAAATEMTIEPAAERICRDDDAEYLLDLLLDDETPRLHPDDVVPTLEYLAMSLSYPVVRDRLLLNIAFGSDACDQVIGDAWVGVGNEPLLGESDRLRDAFDPDRCERAIPVLRSVARRAPMSVRPYVHATIAWVYWAIGQCTPAAGWAERALEVLPELSLAEEVRVLVQAGIVAPWFGKAPRRARGATPVDPPAVEGGRKGRHPDAA